MQTLKAARPEGTWTGTHNVLFLKSWVFEPESQYLSAQGSNSDKQQLTQPLHPGLAASPRNAAAAHRDMSWAWS